MPSTPGRVHAAWALVAAALVRPLAGCGGIAIDPSDADTLSLATASDSSVAAAQTSNIELEVQFPQGTVVTRGSYTLTGQNGFRLEAVVAFAGSDAPGIFIDRVPVSGGTYTLVVTASSADASDVCSGSASFTLAAMRTIQVFVFARCSEG
jgi:hypothetical protein